VLKQRIQGAQNLGHSRVSAGMSIGHVDNTASGLSWLTETETWQRPHYETRGGGGLKMDPVTFERLINFLQTHSHTGMGHAKQALTQDTDGVNALAREAAHVQSADHVIGPRHALFEPERY